MSNLIKFPDSQLRSQTHPKDNRYHFTDLGNAERLVSQYGKDLRFCYPWGKWLIWDGQRWRPDTTGEVIRKAKDTVRHRQPKGSETG